MTFGISRSMSLSHLETPCRTCSEWKSATPITVISVDHTTYEHAFLGHAQALLWTTLFWNPHYSGPSEWKVDHTNYECSKIVWTHYRASESNWTRIIHIYDEFLHLTRMSMSTNVDYWRHKHSNIREAKNIRSCVRSRWKREHGKFLGGFPQLFGYRADWSS